MIFTKKLFALHYKISNNTLRKLLNETYFDQLEPLGYTKHCRILNPNVVRKFMELYGKPLNNEEL